MLVIIAVTRQQSKNSQIKQPIAQIARYYFYK